MTHDEQVLLAAARVQFEDMVEWRDVRRVLTYASAIAGAWANDHGSDAGPNQHGLRVIEWIEELLGHEMEAR
jgi:hypothetical protein